MLIRYIMSSREAETFYIIYPGYNLSIDVPKYSGGIIIQTTVQHPDIPAITDPMVDISSLMKKNTFSMTKKVCATKRTKSATNNFFLVTLYNSSSCPYKSIRN